MSSINTPWSLALKPSEGPFPHAIVSATGQVIGAFSDPQHADHAISCVNFSLIETNELVNNLKQEVATLKSELKGESNDRCRALEQVENLKEQVVELRKQLGQASLFAHAHST